jgi:hypothetical protein
LSTCCERSAARSRRRSPPPCAAQPRSSETGMPLPGNLDPPRRVRIRRIVQKRGDDQVGRSADHASNGSAAGSTRQIRYRGGDQPTTRSLHVLTGMSELNRAISSIEDQEVPSHARSNPACPLLGLLLRSLSNRRSAAATRSRARSGSATVYSRGSGRVRLLRGPFAALLARMAALS